MTKTAKTAKSKQRKNGELVRAFTIAATPTELRLWKELAAKDNRSLSAWIRLIANQKVVDHEARKLAIEKLEREVPGSLGEGDSKQGRSRGETDAVAAVPVGGAGGDADRG